jgi:hypothetical protein
MGGVANRMRIGYSHRVGFRVKNHIKKANVTFTNAYLAEYYWTLFHWCFYPASPCCPFVEVPLRCPSALLFYVACLFVSSGKRCGHESRHIVEAHSMESSHSASGAFLSGSMVLLSITSTSHFNLSPCFPHQTLPSLSAVGSSQYQKQCRGRNIPISARLHCQSVGKVEKLI